MAAPRQPGDSARRIPHDGYEGWEIPVYERCRNGCGQLVRADRLDLLREHDELCTARPTRDQPSRRLGLSAYCRRLLARLRCRAAGSGSSFLRSEEPAAIPSRNLLIALGDDAS